MEVLGSLIITIAQSILLYGRELGISILLITLIGIATIWYILYKKDKIVNKKAMLLMIPIILLSSTYFIYGNTTFYITNIIMILALTLLMFKVAISKTNITKEYFFATLNLLPDTIEEIENVTKITKQTIDDKIIKKVNIDKGNLKKIASSLFIVIIVVGIVIMLLASADSVFASIFTGVDDILKNINIENAGNLILRILICIIVYVITLSLIISIPKDDTNDKKEIIRVNPDKFTIKMLLVALNIVYLIFCYIQITSLFTRINEQGTFNYAEYARSGFFQLMIVSFINFVLILISNYNNDKREGFIKILNLFLIVFTIIIVLSSIYRMYMYETAYGFTYLRLFVYIILATELILFVPTVIYVYNAKFDLLKWGGIIGICIYTGINFANLENIIITRNLKREDATVNIDYSYIAEIASSDNYSILEELFTNPKVTNKEKLTIGKKILEIANSSKEMKWQEFNISKYKLKDKTPEDMVDIKELEEKVREERKINVETEVIHNYIYDEMINEQEGYRVEQIDSVSGTSLWQIEKTIDNGATYKVINKFQTTTPSKIVFFENGLGFLMKPNNIYCKESKLYITKDSGKTFKEIDFPKGEFTLSEPGEQTWEECYDYYELPTIKEEKLQVMVSGGYSGGYNDGKTRAKYISEDNGNTWIFEAEVFKQY